MKQNEDGSWVVAPLSFKKDRPTLQTNKSQAVNRAYRKRIKFYDKAIRGNFRCYLNFNL